MKHDEQNICLDYRKDSVISIVFSNAIGTLSREIRCKVTIFRNLKKFVVLAGDTHPTANTAETAAFTQTARGAAQGHRGATGTSVLPLQGAHVQPQAAHTT